MGKRGPAATPTVILQKRGSGRAKTRPAPVDNLPPTARAPVWLDEAGRQIWKAKRDLLAAVGLLTPLDEIAFARYCTLLSVWLKLDKFRQEHGEVYQTSTGWALRPQVTLWQKLSDQLLKLEQAFGLTPSARAHLDVKAPERPPHGNSREHRDVERFFRIN